MTKEDIRLYEEKEKLLIDLEYQLIEDFIRVRKNQKVTQEELAQSSKVIRQTINRIEKLTTSPGINTMIKLLEPLGYTLRIVPINEDRRKK